LAVDNINLEIRDGEIFGLIGHNGAGKSTTLNSMVGIIDDFVGTITINNLDRKKDSLELKRIIGYVSDSPDKFLKLRAKTLWNFIADIYGVSSEERKTRLDYMLEK
ncbi:ATP-binding cassette domain-containing protein, partial [Flavonifractor sp. DFI.6.63]